MQTSKLAIGTVYAQEKDSYTSRAVMVLDTKLWEMGKAWADGSRKYVIREAPKGVRSHDSNSHSDYRTVGVPVLLLDKSLFYWNEDTRPEMRIMDSHADILASAAKALGIERASDAAGEFVNLDVRRAQVVVTMVCGRKTVVTVTLTTVRPQTIVGAWDVYFAQKEQDKKEQVALREKTDAEKSHRDLVATQVADRLDALLGEANREDQGLERLDCERRDESTFEISEETLLRLLELAEKFER